MHLNIVKTKLLPVLIIGLIAAGNSYAQSQDSSREELSTRRGRVKAQQSEVYHESALRRFEIVTLVSLPFTAIHSFLAVRGVEMIRQNRVAPELDSTDYKIMGASAATLAVFIGFWDWLLTRDKNLSEQLIPTPTPSAPTRNNASANEWELEDSPGFFVPLVHFRF